MTVCTRWCKTSLEGRTPWADVSLFLKKSETSAHGVLPSLQYVDAELVNSTESPQGSLGILFLLGVKVLTLFFCLFLECPKHSRRLHMQSLLFIYSSKLSWFFVSYRERMAKRKRVNQENIKQGSQHYF